MVPYAFGSSDGLFNLGSALSFVQVLPPGVYVAMNGQHFEWDRVRKNSGWSLRVRRHGGSGAAGFEKRSNEAAGETDEPRHFTAPLMSAPQLHSKLPSVGTTIFTVMSRLAADVGAINLSQGFPDFDCDPALIDAVARHMREGRNQYAPMQGVLALRQAIAANTSLLRRAATIPTPRSRSRPAAPRRSSTPWPRWSDRATRSIVLEPCYDSYVPAIELSGGVPVVVPLPLPDYRVDWDAVRAPSPRERA